MLMANIDRLMQVVLLNDEWLLTCPALLYYT